MGLTKAFTLIELLIVITIIGILSAIALPSYNAYVKKGAIADGITVADRVKEFTINFYLKNGQMPTNTDLAKEFSTTVVAGNKIAVGSGSVAYVGYPANKTDQAYSIIQLNNSVGGGTKNTFYIGIKAQANGSFIVKCGIWNVSSPGVNDITDVTYFPPNCNATDVYTAWQ